MASIPIGAESADVTTMPAVAHIMAQFEPTQLAGFIEVAIGLLDIAGDVRPQASKPRKPPQGDAEDNWLGVNHRCRGKRNMVNANGVF